MAFILLFILILVSFVLYVVKCVGAVCKDGFTHKNLERASIKALRATAFGVIAMGLVLLFLVKFDWFSCSGHSLLSKEFIRLVRNILYTVFNTTSVFVVAEIFLLFLSLTVEFTLAVACIGIFAGRKILIFGKLLRARVCSIIKETNIQEVKTPCVSKGLFLGFSNLRI